MRAIFVENKATGTVTHRWQLSSLFYLSENTNYFSDDFVAAKPV
jgi:hypothetical protein